MSRKAREIETIVLAMLAAAPLYVTFAVGKPAVALFHGAMTLIAYRIWKDRGPELVPTSTLRMLAIAYVPFYLIDATMISGSAIAASTHLVLFISVYQTIESARVNNYAQRMLTTALIFIASLGTSTHIAVIPFVVLFGFAMFRQFMYVSHIETVRAVGREYEEAPSSRAAMFYLVGSAVIGVILFPLLPRNANPMVRGWTGPLGQASTGLTDAINLKESRSTVNDTTVVARVWMGPDTMPFFTPLRLRGAVYDRYKDGEWLQSPSDFREARGANGSYRVARQEGFARNATVEQRLDRRGRVFLPVNTFAVNGIPNLFEGPSRDAYTTIIPRGEMVSFEARMAYRTEPLRLQRIPLANFPVTQPITDLALQVAGDAATPEEKAKRVEMFLFRNFRYVPNGAEMGKTMSVEEFLLRDRRGHCEYFAAGMVAMMTSLEVPARIAGGFYGGQLNPLAGYFIVRREDAHAWVEVWDGARWLTFDPTPPLLRPGNTKSGLVRAYATAISDAISYFWDRYVLTFSFADQVQLLRDLAVAARDGLLGLRNLTAGGARQMRSPLLLTIVVLVLAAAVLAMVIVRRRQAAFTLLARHLQRLGIELSPAMTMEDALRILRADHPAAARDLEPLIALYEEEAFSATKDRRRVAMIRKRLAEMS